MVRSGVTLFVFFHSARRVDDTAWPSGVYRWFPPGVAARLVVVSELPVTRATLVLRILGAGPVLRAAIAELVALPKEAPERAIVRPLMLDFLKEVCSASRRAEEEESGVTNTREV